MSGKKSIHKYLLRATEKIKSLFFDIREAISGTDKDFTSIPLRKAILLLSIPMILEMIMESVFAVVDIFFVSKLGAEAVATVGLTESVMTLIYAIGFGLSISTTALVSRRIGEKRKDLAADTAFQAILTGIIASFIISVPGFLYPEELLDLMGASDEVIEIGAGYTRLMLGTNMIIMLLFIMNAVLRSSGDAASSMKVLFYANLINIILDPCLIFGLGPFPEMGVTGAATATVIGRGLAVIYQFYILFSGKSRIKLGLKDIRFNFPVMWKLVKLSLGGIGQNIIATSSWIVMIRLIAEFGSVVLAGYTIAIRIVIFSLLPSWGLANAAATLVGQNLGAGRPERAEKSVWTAGFVNMALLGLISVFFIIYAEPLIRLFTPQADIVKAGAGCLRIISAGFLFYGLGMVMVQSFNGAGDTNTPTWINLVCFWLLEIPLAYFLAKIAGFDQQGVYFSIVIAESTLAVVAMILFRRGTWKKEKV
jgi:putative MATE family efflux protein